MLPQLLALTLALAPSLVLAGIFPPDSLVKMLDPKGFKNVMKENRTIMVAFVAPWCGHCQKMAPEYSKAAFGLHPLIPTYAVDCDSQINKRLCSEQGVAGFPTVKLFPRGKTRSPSEYQGRRTASDLFHFAAGRVPNKVKKLNGYENILDWVAQKQDRIRLLLLTKDEKVPLLWQVLDNRYQEHFAFGSLTDEVGKVSVKLGYEGSKKGGIVLVYPIGSKKPIRYEGISKYEPLVKFLDSILDGTADLKDANEKVESEADVVTPEDVKEKPTEQVVLDEPSTSSDPGTMTSTVLPEPTREAMKDEL